MGDYSFWTNGIATIIETPDQALVQHRSDLGTVVEQAGNTQGWFHIPLTTPSVVHNDGSFYLTKVFLTVNLNQHATLDAIHIRNGTDLIDSKFVEHNNKGILFSSFFEIVPRILLTESVDVDGNGIVKSMYNCGLAMSIHIKFGPSNGRVEFKSAGVRFETS